MSSERPIPFSGDMVRAILDGRKTQSRRIIKPQPLEGYMVAVCPYVPSGWAMWEMKDGKPYGCECSQGKVRNSYGKVGDLLWVREAWACGTHMGQLVKTPKELGRDMWVAWKENYYDDAPALKQLTWKPSRFMPKWAARIWLEITNIRVERVQDIDKKWENCLKEGVVGKDEPCCDVHGLHQIVLFKFIDLWDSLNAKRGFGWDKNPWVWVIEFKRIDR